MIPAPARKDRRDKGGRSQRPPFSFGDCALARSGQSRLSGPRCPNAVLQGPDPLESQPESPEDAPREPILTLPGALTAYIALIAIIHLRVLLPPELENWTIDVFGFIPKRYDSTLLDITFPGGAGAKVWTFVTYCRSAARWRAGSARSGSTSSWR